MQEPADVPGVQPAGNLQPNPKDRVSLLLGFDPRSNPVPEAVFSPQDSNPASYFVPYSEDIQALYMALDQPSASEFDTTVAPTNQFMPPWIGSYVSHLPQVEQAPAVCPGWNGTENDPSMFMRTSSLNHSSQNGSHSESQPARTVPCHEPLLSDSGAPSPTTQYLSRSRPIRPSSRTQPKKPSSTRA